MPATIMRCGRTFRLARTHPAHARSSGSETLSRSRSLVDYTIDTHESEVFGSHSCVAAKRRYVPAADICSAAKTSLDHLVSNLLKMHRDIKSKGLSHPEIDKKLETGRLLHRKFTRLCAFQNLVDIDSHTPERVENVRPVCHKRTSVKGRLA